MVNEMLKVAGDKEIENYVSGKTTAMAGSRLEKIYEEEKSRKTSDKEDILTAIQRRQSTSTHLVPERALSDLSATLSQDSNDEPDRRKSRVVNRWSSRKLPPKSDVPKNLPPRAAPKLAQSPKDTDKSSRRKSRVVNRWSSKASQPHTPSSEVLSSVSESTQEVEVQKKRRESVVNRWASKSPTGAEVTHDAAKDNDDDSIGAFEEMIDKRKQKAFNRWASKRS
jgi:hypothetical protein